MEQESGQLVGRRQFIRVMGATAAVGMTAALVGCSKTADAAVGQAVGWTDIEYEYEVDVLVVGAGASGLMAAYGAAKGGKSVLAIEKQASYGGDAANAANDYMVPYTKFCAEKRPTQAKTLQSQLDKIDKTWFPDDAVTAAIWKNWYTNAAAYFDLMAYEWGVEFDVDVNNNGPYPGMFYPKGGIGQGLQVWPKVYAAVEKTGTQFLFNTKAEYIIVDTENNIVGLRAYDSKNEVFVDIKSPNIVLATGGFASNQEMMAKYYPDYVNIGCVTTQATGDGFKLAQSVGAGLSKKIGGAVNLNAHTEVIFLAQMFGRSFSILPNGKRFFCETSVHDPAGKCVEANYYDWIAIFDSEIMNGPNKTKVATGGKYLLTGNTVAELAAKLTMPVATLQAAFDDWNAICAAGVDKAFGRTLHLKPLQPPYYAYINHPVRYKTSGGLSINNSQQVLDKDGKVITGLWACGCTGGTTDIGPAAGSGLYTGTTIASQA